MRKKYEKIASLKEQMRVMLDTAESTNRSLTDEEMKEFTDKKDELRILQMQVERSAIEPDGEPVQRGSSAFATVVYAITNRRSLDCYGSAVSENGIKVMDRAAPMDTTAAEPMIPVTIQEVLEPLEKGLILDKIGVKMQTGLVGELIFPTLQAIEASVAGETAPISDTEISIGKIKSSPKRVALSVPVSKLAIRQTNYSLQNIVLKQLSMGVARLLNKWMFATEAIAGTSGGVITNAKSKITGTAQPTFADMVELETTVMAEGIDVTDGTACYVLSPKAYGRLKSTPVESGSAEMICRDHQINGYPVFVTSYVDADTICFGVFSYVGLGQFGEMDLVVDPYTGAKSNIVNFVINTEFDIVIARPEAFAVFKSPTSKAKSATK